MIEDTKNVKKRRRCIELGKWDEPTQFDTLHELLAYNKYFIAENVIDQIAKDGIHLGKLPEHFILDEHSRLELESMVNEKLDNLEGIASISDAIMGFLKGYSEGIREASQDRKMTDL